jgi:hypothetical protein
MKKTFKKDACGLILLGLLPILLLPLVNRIHIERIAQKDVKGACSPADDDCLTKLIRLAQTNPYTYRFRVEGDSLVANDPSSGYQQTWERKWFYDRENQVVVGYRLDSEHFGYKGEWSASKTIYHGVNDALLQKFAKEPGLNNQFSDFKAFCKANGRRIEEDDDLNNWSQWKKPKQ